MASTSALYNMTVPTSDGTSGLNILMPKLQYRFRALFNGFGTDANTLALTRQVMDITRPQVTFDEVTLDVYNSKIYVPGKHTWSETTVNVRDDVSGAISKLVAQQLQKQIDFTEQSGQNSGQDYKFQLVYEVLDGGNGVNTPTVLERWELLGCYLKAVNYNNMDYKTSEAVTINMQIRFDNAIQTALPDTTTPDTTIAATGFASTNS